MGSDLIAYEEIMNDELDKFTRKGYDLFLVDEEGEIRHCLSGLSSKEKATERFKLCSVRYRKGVVRDDVTREKSLYYRSKTASKKTKGETIYGTPD